MCPLSEKNTGKICREISAVKSILGSGMIDRKEEAKVE